MCGFGYSRILRLTGQIALVVAIMVLFLMIAVNPWVSAKRQQVMSSDEATVHLVQTMIPGRFQVSPDGRHVMYVEKLSRDRNRAQTVFLAQEKKSDSDLGLQNPWMLVFADEGYQVKDKETQEQYFVTADGYRYEGTPGQNAYKIVQFKKYWVRIPQNDVRVSHEEVETLSTWQLWQDYKDPKRAAEFQWRFSATLTTFLLALLAVLLSTVHPRQSRYLVLLPAVLVYIIYIELQIIARHWVEQGTVPISIGMWWVHGLMLLLICIVTLLNIKPWAGKR
jgi:lipopolysaccharide export system permease protein